MRNVIKNYFLEEDAIGVVEIILILVILKLTHIHSADIQNENYQCCNEGVYEFYQRYGENSCVG